MKDFDSWDVCDQCCGFLFDKTKFAEAKGVEWCRRESEFVKGAGFVLMAAEKKQTTDIRKFEEIGTRSATPRLAIGEAILFHNGIGGRRKEARLRYLSRYWMNRLKDLPNVRFNTSFDDSQSWLLQM